MIEKQEDRVSASKALGLAIPLTFGTLSYGVAFVTAIPSELRQQYALLFDLIWIVIALLWFAFLSWVYPPFPRALNRIVRYTSLKLTHIKDKRRKAKYLKMFQDRFWPIVDNHRKLCYGPRMNDFTGTLGADLYMKGMGEHRGLDEWRLFYTKPLWMLGKYYDRALLNLKRPLRRFDDWALALTDFTFVMAMTVAYVLEPITKMCEGYEISLETENRFNDIVREYEEKVRKPFSELVTDAKKTIREFSGITFQVDKLGEVHKTRI